MATESEEASQMLDLTTAVDRMTCPACHRPMEPEYRTYRDGATVQIRVRCPGCGRLWFGNLGQPREERIEL